MKMLPRKTDDSEHTGSPAIRSIHQVMAFFVLVEVLHFSCVSQLLAEPAHFWISTSNVLPDGPEAPSIPGVEGSLRYLHIWAQPATVDDGPYSGTNPFKTLKNFSLNLVASDSAIEFVDSSIVVYNPQLDATTKRFQEINDFSQGLISSTQLPDRIDGLQGFSITGGSAFAGIGPTCHPNDPYCAETSTGAPAWLIGSVASRTIASSGTADYFLRVGSNGMNHGSEGSAQTFVVFGFDAAGEPVYNAGSQRDETQAGDNADFGIQAIPTPTATHWLGGSGQWSSNNWGNGAGPGPPSWGNNAFLDAGLGANVVTVTGKQQANQTTVNGGRLHIVSDSSLASDVTVASGGAISGEGWVGADLTLQGSLTANPDNPLLVAGKSVLTGGTLVLPSGYTLLPNHTSAPFKILTSLAGLTGTLNATVGQSLGAGFTLASISYGSRDVTISVRFTTADFNGDGVVDAGDYVLWRNTMGQTGVNLAADGNGNNQIDSGDYTFWKSRFGATFGSASGQASIATDSVPEPNTLALMLLSLSIASVLPRRFSKQTRH